MLKKVAILLILLLSGCSTNQSPELIPDQLIDDRLLEAPLPPSLVVPCRVAYPLRDLSPEESLGGLYKTFIYNYGQVEKCYNKDAALVEEIRKRESEKKDQ